jgi:hypothetical protein
MTVEHALDALNDVAMDPKLTYEETREGLLRIQTHVAHLLTHFPIKQTHNYEYGGGSFSD